MKRGKGGDSLDALRAIWNEGYNRGRADMARELAAKPPVVEVEIDPADLMAVFEPGARGYLVCPECAPPPRGADRAVPLYHCSGCGRELMRSRCRKCGTFDNPATNEILPRGVAAVIPEGE